MTVAGVSRSVSSVAVSGSTVQLTLSSVVGVGQAVTVAYTAPASDSSVSNIAIQDTVGNDAISLTSTSVTNSSTVDITAPTFSSAAVGSTGLVLTLTYSEALNSTTAQTSAFAVTVAGVSRSVSSVAVSGSTVQLTLASAVERGSVVTVAYTAPASNNSNSNNAIQDSTGNDAISLGSTSVTNSSTVDSTPPTFVSAILGTTGVTLTLTYDEALHATTAATSAYSVLVDGILRTVSNAVVSGSTVQLTLTPAVQGSSTVTVAYAAPSSSNLTTNNAIQDSAGNDAASLSQSVVTNNSTEGPPRLISAEVLPAGNQMKMTWSETLGSTYPLGTAFTILVNGSPVTVTGINTVTPSNYFTFNLSQTITSNQTVTVTYVAPVSDNSTTNNAVQDTGGNDALAFSNTAVINGSTVAGDTTPPTLLSASLNTTGTVLSLSYNETLNAVTAPASAFSVVVNGVSYSVSSVAISTSVVQLTLGSAIEAGKTVTVAYTAPTTDSWATNAAIQDTAGNDALSLSAQSVTNNSTAGPDIAPPKLSTVSASGTLLTLAFNESLRSTPTPPLSTFTVFVGETPVTPTGITISGTSVFLTLPSSVPSGTVVQVSYLAPAVDSANTNAAVQDIIGNDALSFNGTTNPSSSTWNWTTPYDAATNAPIDCDGAGSINRAKQTTLPNGVTYTVAVTGPYLCINEVTESLAQRGGQPQNFVATGLVTEPGLKLTTTNVNCPADSICNDRGTLTLSFGQPVKNPVFSFAGWGGRSSGTSWSEMTLSAADIAKGITMTPLSGTNIYVSPDGTFVGDNGQSSNVSCNAGAVCGSLQINGTISSVSFIVQMQTSGGTGYKDAWNLTASMAEDFGLVPSTYESSGVASHGVGALKMGATVTADQASALYATTNADAVPRWTSLANNAKKDDGVADWVDSPNITMVPGTQYSTTVALGGVENTANLCAWIDFNRDEVFSFDERTCAVDPVAGATSATLTWTVPSVVGSGLTYARVRLSYDSITVPTGKLGSGEVEDYSLVLPANNLPAAVNDTSINGQDVNQTISPLSNDQFETGFSANNATLKLCGSGQLPNNCNVTVLAVDGQGTYTVNADGTVTFDPLPNFTGTATPVTYQITDTYGSPRTTSGTITPTVTPRPAASADTSLDLLNIPQSKNPLANDSAGSASIPLVASSVRLCLSGQTPPTCNATSVAVTGGTYSVNQTTGIVTFTPALNFSGTATPVTYQVSDTLNQVASTTYTPTVIPTPTATNDTSSGAWNVNQTISPFSNDSNASGHPLGNLVLCGTSPLETPNNCSQPTLTTSDGTYTVNADGTVTFDPLPTFTGTVTQPVTYQAKDDLNQFVSALITPSVTPPPAPTAVPDTSLNLVNVTQTKNVLTNDTTTDPLITLDATSVRLCSSGQVKPNCTATSVVVTGGTYSVDASTGIVSFTPDTNWSGTPTPVAYQVTDSTNQKVSSTYSPTVIPKPAATNDLSSGAWDVNQTITPFSNDSIAAGHPLTTLRLCGGNETPNGCTTTTLIVDGQGTYTVNANGTVTFDPLPTFTGTATSVKYQAIDDLGQYVNATITPSVTPPPAPVAVADTSNDFLNVVQTKNVLANDTTSNPLITLDASSVRLCSAGEVRPNCTATSVVVVGGTYSVNTTTGAVSFTPDNNWSGTAPAVTYQVTDSTNQTVSATYTPTVFPKPTATNDTSTGAYDTNQIISPFGNDSFAGSSPVVLSTLQLCGPSETPNNCTQTSLTVSGQGTYTVNANGTVTFDPLPTFSGTATPVTYQAADTLGQFVSATITPTVAAPTAPVASPQTQSVLPGGTAIFTTITGASGLATGTQLQTSGSKATCLITPNSSPAACEMDNVVDIAGEGTYTLNPSTGVVTFVASQSITGGTKTPITYRVTDITGQTATSTLTPVVPPAPVALADTSFGNYDTDQTLNILSNDEPGDTSAPLVPTSVKLCGSGQTPNGCNVTTLAVLNEGTYTVNPDGSVTFNPLSTFTGTATPITYQIADTLGQVTSSTITPTVYTPPDAKNDVSSGNYDTNQIIDPLANDLEGSGTLDPRTVKLCSSGQVAPNCTATTLAVSGQGTYMVDPVTGVVTFDPLPTFTGTATPITYQVSDSLGQTDSATITPTVGAPPLPIAVNDAITSNWDTNQSYTPTLNDTVGSAFPLIATTVKLCATGQTVPGCNATTLSVSNEGVYTVNANGTVTFDPLPSFSGTGTPITYQATDSLGRADDATITPTVTPPPAPSATPETKAVIPGGTATFTTITGTSGLATGTQLQTSGSKATCLITPASSPAVCDADNVVTISGEGTFTLNPATGVVTFVADVSATAGTKTALTYRVTDVTGQTATSTLTPVIPQPPVANPDTNTGNWDTNQTISPLANDTAGAVSAPLVASTVKLCGVAPSAQTPNNCTQTSLAISNQGTYTVNPDGTVTFDPLPTFNGTATAVKYQVADILGQVANSTITPTVLAPRTPTATPDTKTGNWDTNQTITPLSNDTPGEPTAPLIASTVKLCGVAPNAQTPNNCTQTSLAIANQGAYTVNADGTVTFDPLPSFTGTATAVKYQVTDSIGQTVNTTITPTVLAPPPPVASPGTVSLIAGGTKDFAPIFGTNALAAKATSGPDLTNSTVCIVDPVTNVCGTTSVTIAGEGTFTLDITTGIVTYTALSTATAGAKTAISYKITDALNVTVTSTLTPTIIPKPTARPDTSIGVMEQTQTLSPVGNDSPGAIAYPLDPKTVLLCGATETAPACTKTTVTVSGEGTYVVQSNGTVKFTPEAAYYGTATPVRYIVKDTLGQVATSTLTPIVVPPPAPITELDTGIAEQGSTVVLSPWSNDNGGVVPAGVTGTVELVPNSIRLCGNTDSAPTCTRTSLTTDDGTYTVNTSTGQVTFVHRQGFLGTVTQPVTYQIANNWTGLSGIGITTNILIPTIIPPAPPAPPAPAPVAVLADPYAVDDVSFGPHDINQIIAVFTNDVFPGSEASFVSLKLCANSVRSLATGQVEGTCNEVTLVVAGEGTYTVNPDGTVTFDPLSSFHGTATPIRYQAVDILGRFVNSTITPTVDAPPVIITVSNELPATGQNLAREIAAVMLLLAIGFGLRRRFK